MTQQQNNFLNIIRAYVDQDYTPIIESPDWNEIYRLAYIHSLSGMLYVTVQDRNLCSDEALLNNMARAFMLTVGNSVNKELAFSAVLDILTNNGIRHIVFKGTVVREYYPDKELRTMGDIDLAIDKADKDGVHKVMLDAGASYDEVDSHAEVSNYELNVVVFEIHTNVMESNLFDDVDYIGYFSDLFSRAEARKVSSKEVGSEESYTYELKKEFHLIYLLVHMAKHFKFGGCGLRMYMDIVMFLCHFNGELDWDYVREELKKLKLIHFADSVFQFCNRWFGTDIAVLENEISDSEMEIITEYVLAGGTFGYHGKNVDAIRAENKDSGWFSKIKTVGCFIFPSYDHLKRRYEWMGETPKWLLPVAWVRYWYYRIFVVKQSKQDTLKRIKQATESSEDALEHYRLMEKIGLA
ncbi:MAG: nucleotidyltransferase family protein [Rikenellaceae bacterium]|nr:nucleotidyltransferase family protein [Rikenellaceae bacterium]